MRGYSFLGARSPLTLPQGVLARAGSGGGTSVLSERSGVGGSDEGGHCDPAWARYGRYNDSNPCRSGTSLEYNRQGHHSHPPKSIRCRSYYLLCLEAQGRRPPGTMADA
jgi:hypothetical protein